MTEVKSALFVCLGNICRSPIAEGVFLHLIKEKGVFNNWKVDSAAIAPYHTGKPPDHRSIETMKKHNVQYKNKARPITSDDFRTFDYIFGMDEENMHDLDSKAPKDSKAKLLLLGDFDPEGDRIIKDPYYDTGSQGFEKCFQQCMRSCIAFLEQHG